MTKSKASKTLQVKLIGSLIGQGKIARATVKGLGLRKLNSTKTLEDTAATRGMINKIPHLVKIVNG